MDIRLYFFASCLYLQEIVGCVICMAPMPMRIVHHIHTYHTYAHTYSRPRANIHISAYVARLHPGARSTDATTVFSCAHCKDTALPAATFAATLNRNDQFHTKPTAINNTSTVIRSLRTALGHHPFYHFGGRVGAASKPHTCVHASAVGFSNRRKPLSMTLGSKLAPCWGNVVHVIHSNAISNTKFCDFGFYTHQVIAFPRL